MAWYVFHFLTVYSTFTWSVNRYLSPVYDTSTTQWWARMMKEWCAWEYLVMRTIISLEQVTKDSEMKWVVSKGNEILFIIPLSFLSDMRRPMWVADRRSEFRMIRMGLDQVWNVNVSTIGSWIKGLGFWAKPSSNFYCFPTTLTANVYLLQYSRCHRLRSQY